MKRIYIVGQSGVGKSTLGRNLSTVLDIPHLELDYIYFDAYGEGANKEEFLKIVHDFVELESWVIDGNIPSVRQAVRSKCDTIIILDYSRLRTFYQMAQRQLSKSAGYVRDLREIDWARARALWLKFFQNVYRLLFVRKKRNYLRDLPGHLTPQIEVLRFRNPRETAAWLESLPS